MLASAEYRRATGRSWVGSLYRDVLGREAGAGETAYCSARAGDLGPLGVVRAIWYSPEAVGGRVADTYAELLGRSASPGEVDLWRTAETRSDLATRVAVASSAECSRPGGEGQRAFVTDQSAAVESYLDEIAAGRWRQAYDRLSDESRTAVGGCGGFYALRTGLAEGLGAFAAVPRRGYLATGVDDGSTAVVVAGQVLREGDVAFDTASFGVRLDGAGDGLGIDAFLRPVGLRLAPADRTLDPGEPLTLTVDRRGPQAWSTIIVDGRPGDLPYDAGSTDRTFTLRLPSSGTPRRAVVTAVAQVADGPLQVESDVFTVR